MANLPACRNETCPCFKSTKDMIVIQENPIDVTFGCKTCGGIQVRTLNWKRGEQGLDYQRKGTPEYARNRRFFFQGSRQHIGG